MPLMKWEFYGLGWYTYIKCTIYVYINRQVQPHAKLIVVANLWKLFLEAIDCLLQLTALLNWYGNQLLYWLLEEVNIQEVKKKIYPIDWYKIALHLTWDNYNPTITCLNQLLYRSCFALVHYTPTVNRQVAVVGLGDCHLAVNKMSLPFWWVDATTSNNHNRGDWHQGV